MGFVIAAGTPFFIWTYMSAAYPALPSVNNIDTDLWSFLLKRVLLFSTLIEFCFLLLSFFLQRFVMLKTILSVSAIYLIVALHFRWEWL